MKATGIVRRIDDLGRVVIPKEIRRVMRIREGDPLEIFTEGGGEVIFKKYSPVGELESSAAECAEALSKETALGVIICDRDSCVAASGISKNETLEKRITKGLERVMEDRRSIIPQNPFAPLEGSEVLAVAASPIITAGDVAGCVVLLKSERQQTAGDTDLKLCTLASKFLANKIQ